MIDLSKTQPINFSNTTFIHDADTCQCDMCRWANEAEARQSLQSRKQRINEARRQLIDEIDRMQAEVNRLDEEYDSIEDQEMKLHGT